MKKSISPMLRWVLGRGTARIACELSQNSDRTFDVRVVPSWGRQPLVNQFPDVVQAMAGHAEAAGKLRDSGWRVVERTSTPARHAAA
jgi:hypothetical protein